MINCFAANSRGVRPFAPLYVDIFADDPASTSRGGVLQLGQNDEWQLHRRYMHLEGLQTLSDNKPARLSAAVNRVPGATKFLEHALVVQRFN
jgi:hypothetical protein